MNKFSSIINNSTLNDFLKPSQSCIILTNDAKPHETTIGKEVKINLSDCLSCSGCITSTESLLLSSSIAEDFKRTLKNKNQKSPLIVVFVCNQTFVSFASQFGESISKSARKLVSLLKTLGIDLVFNLNVASEVMVTYVADEFLSALKEEGKLPLLTSTCPGWVSYAEKMLGELFFPHMSRIPSAQTIMAQIIKERLKPLSWSKSSLYVVSVMSCYDRRIEALRTDSHIDSVLTTEELYTILCENFEGSPTWFRDSPEERFDIIFDESEREVVIPHDDCSGSLLYRAYKRTFEELNRGEFSPSQHFIATKSKGLREVVLEASSGGLCRDLRFGYVYGFRNIHNLVQRIKRNRCEYDFVEIMACNNGCLGGGGQISGQSDVDSFEKLCMEESNFTACDKFPVVPKRLEFRRVIPNIINVTW